MSHFQQQSFLFTNSSQSESFPFCSIQESDPCISNHFNRRFNSNALLKNDDTKSVGVITAETSYSSDGSISTDSHEKDFIPESSHNTLLDQDRNENDVLLGRGKGANNWIGNKRFREIVTKFQKDYFEASRKEKPLLAKRVADVVRNQVPLGRFLQCDSSSGYWYEVDEDEVIRKTSQALREGKKQRTHNKKLRKLETKQVVKKSHCQIGKDVRSMGPLKKRVFKYSVLDHLNQHSHLAENSSIAAAYALLEVHRETRHAV